MKKLIIILTIFLTSGICFEATAQEFHRQTKHRTVKTLKLHQLRKIQSGHNLYSRDSRGVFKTSRVYSGINRPKDAAKTNAKKARK